jgi:hypothetical protein
MSSENNNALVGKLPDHPHPLLSTLKPLVGSWTISGPEVQGGIRCSFMEGGFYFIQEIELINFGRRYSGIEYVSYDEDTKTLRSRLMGTDGARYTYTWEMDGKQRTIWFGDLGSPHFTKAEFTSDDCLEGTWQWPNSDGSSGGYAYVMKRDRYVPESTAAASA